MNQRLQTHHIDLVIDIGNRKIHFGIFENDQLIKTGEHSLIAIDSIDEFWTHFSAGGAVSDIVIASVNPPAESKIKRWIQERTGIRPKVVRVDIPLPAKVLCDDPSAVGVDRILCVCAAFKRLNSACIVVDYGTAVTFDVASPSGDFIGGVIAPGLGLSRDALHEHTALLPFINVTQPQSVLGKNTVAAMNSGLFWGFVGLVDSIIGRLQSELPFETAVVATGGDAPLLAPKSSFISQVIPTLVLEGIYLALQKARDSLK